MVSPGTDRKGRVLYCLQPEVFVELGKGSVGLGNTPGSGGVGVGIYCTLL